MASVLTVDRGQYRGGRTQLSGDAGMAVELSVAAEPRVNAQEGDQTAHRVMQGALTDVHRHVAGVTWVGLTHRSAGVAMQVENGPPDGATADAGLPVGVTVWQGCGERVLGLGVFVGRGRGGGPVSHGVDDEADVGEVVEAAEDEEDHAGQCPDGADDDGQGALGAVECEREE